MQDNPFAGRAEVTIDMEEVDEYNIERNVVEKQYDLFEVDLLFFYVNSRSNTFVEFELDDISAETTYQEALDIFMQRVMECGKLGATALPDELLMSLSDAELSLFTTASIEERYYTHIKERLFVQKKDVYYYDEYGFKYIVSAVGFYDATLWYEQQGGTRLKIHVHPDQLADPNAKLQIKCVEGF